ncbi:MAG: hypothetical protein M1835_006734 [Candelina submexicana]|nr:MAG: hypothetical protein M1835_006734 [Candelina submexicana]
MPLLQQKQSELSLPSTARRDPHCDLPPGADPQYPYRSLAASRGESGKLTGPRNRSSAELLAGTPTSGPYLCARADGDGHPRNMSADLPESVRDFLGPRTTSSLLATEAEPPMYKAWLNRVSQRAGGILYDARHLDECSKNFPKMHMVKVRSDVNYCRLALDILARDKYLRQLRFIVPAGSEVARVGIDKFWADEGFGEGLEFLNLLDRIVLVMRADSRFNVLDYIDQASLMGWDLLIEHGSLLNNTTLEYEAVTEQHSHPAPRNQYAYLDCMQDLFSEGGDISVYADGGRVKNRQKRLAQKLKVFGGVPPALEPVL